ncbi:MAG: cobalamin-binding protein, partial [Dehalococcoidia bacterium]|nr:cobalamin-binding protein [Dehalococcoidia bacterium]
SALLTTTMTGMEDVIKAMREAGLKARVMIGGASVTQEFADKIRADGYVPDAPSAVGKAKELVKS